MNYICVSMVPPSPNVLRRKYRNPHVYKKLREAWEHALYYMAGSGRHRNQLQDFARTHKMRVRIILHHRGSYDPDNLYGCLKPVLDALKEVGYIRDDNARCLELAPPEQVLTTSTKENKTEIWIGPVLEGESQQK